MQLLSLLPRAYLMPKFLDKARCQHVIDMASKRLAPSGGWATGWAWVCWPLAPNGAGNSHPSLRPQRMVYTIS